MPLTGVRHDLVQLRALNPHWSLGDLASVLCVSRERVRQLLAAEGLDTRRRTPKRIFAEALQAATEQAQAGESVAAEPKTASPAKPVADRESGNDSGEGEAITEPNSV